MHVRNRYLSQSGSAYPTFQLDQRGLTALDLRAILQKRDNFRAASNKMMYKTTDSQDLKPKKRKRREWVIEIITQWEIL